MQLCQRQSQSMIHWSSRERSPWAGFSAVVPPYRLGRIPATLCDPRSKKRAKHQELATNSDNRRSVEPGRYGSCRHHQIPSRRVVGRFSRSIRSRCYRREMRGQRNAGRDGTCTIVTSLAGGPEKTRGQKTRGQTGRSLHPHPLSANRA